MLTRGPAGVPAAFPHLDFPSVAGVCERVKCGAAWGVVQRALGAGEPSAQCPACGSAAGLYTSLAGGHACLRRGPRDMNGWDICYWTVHGVLISLEEPSSL